MIRTVFYSAITSRSPEGDRADLSFRAERPEGREAASRAFLAEIASEAERAGAVLFHVEPGDGTRYFGSVVRQGGTARVVLALAGMLAAEIDGRFEVEPEGLEDLARSRADGGRGLNPCTAALACDVCNSFTGARDRGADSYYDWEAAQPRM